MWESIATLEGGISVFAGLVMFALAALLLVVDFNNRLHRAFALFLVLRGMLNALVPFGLDPDTFAWREAVTPYFIIAMPFVGLHFALAYRAHWRNDRQHVAPWLLLALTLALEILYLGDHSWFYQRGDDVGPLYPLNGLRNLTYALIALWLAHGFGGARPSPRRVPVLLLSVGFALYPTFLAAAGLIPLVAGYAVGTVPAGIPAYPAQLPVFMLSQLATVAALVPVGLLIIQLRRTAARSGDPAQPAAVRRTLWVFGLAATCGVVSFAGSWLVPPAGPGASQALDGLWTLSHPALVSYAILRHKLFDIDLRLKWTLEKTAYAGALTLAYFAAAGLVQTIGVAGAAPWVGVAAVGLLLLFSPRLRRGSRGVADALMPNVQRSPEYLSMRKLDVYRAALEQAAAAGVLSDPTEGSRLAALRSELGLTERDHAIVLHNVQTGPGFGRAPLELETGAVLLDRYRIRRFLGEGSQGRTYLAEDAKEGRPVVVKAVPRALASDPQVVREAEAIRRIQHPNVIRIHEVRDVGGDLFLVMEYAEGGSLKEQLKGVPFDGKRFRRIAVGLLEALGSVHLAGIVHRDVKPSNVLLTRDGDVKLADFGVAHLPGMETTVGMVRTGGALGTIRYMSPEQAKGRTVTPQSDLFSAGATLFEAYSGRPYLESFPRESAVELQMRAAAAGPFNAGPMKPAAMRAWFARCLHPEARRRFGSADEMRGALQRALKSPAAAVAPRELARPRRSPRTA